MRSENGTSYVYKDSNGDESSFSTQGNEIFNVTSAAETKQLKKITGLDKINNDPYKEPSKFFLEGSIFLQFCNLVQVHFCNCIVTEHRNDHFDLVVINFSDLTSIVCEGPVK